LKKLFLIVLIVVLSFGYSSFAEEGMWLLTQIKNLNLHKNGFKIDVSQIYDPDKPCIMDAVVLLGGGTSEIVSANGLLLTNHHVAFGAVQRASTKGKDYVTKGFLAKTYADEIEAPGYSAYLLKEMKDVTKEVIKAGKKINDPVKRQKAIDRKIKRMTDKIEKGKKDIDARVASMFNGKQYILFVYKRFDDIRVVYVPPKAIGNYGGDIDNWMWPRHTGDFSFMRIYMAPDGTGRKYNKENIPYKAKFWLKVAKTGLKEGDQTFILGYPGGTMRYRSTYSVDHNFNFNYPRRIKLFKEIITLLESFEKDSLTAKMKVAGLLSGLNNAMKNYQGNIDCMKRMNFLDKKKKFQNKFMAFLKGNENLYKQYGGILDKIKVQYDGINKTRDYDSMLGLFGGLSGSILGVAKNIYYIAREREKPKKERDPSFSEKDIKRAVSRLHFRYMSFYEPADQALLKRSLKEAAGLPENQRIKGVEYILQGVGIDKFVENAYKKTKLKDVNFVKTLYQKGSKDLESLDDPFINLAKSLYSEDEAKRKRNEKFGAVIDHLRKEYLDALYAWKGSNFYPDANRTARFSYGKVEGYYPRDAVYYSPFTTIKGAIEKDTGKEPFDLPEGVKDLYKIRDFGQWACPVLKDVPIAFTHKVDSTGGNSGSPVLNARGELVGILFDGNYEAMTSDWQYDDNLQRSISVDIRYVMFITEKLGKADHILKEMGIN
jgi:hypothetical protein